MKLLRRLLTRLRNSTTRRAQEARLREEIEEHIALLTSENLRAGMSPVEARRQAMLKFGGVESMKEDYRAEQRLPWIEHLLQDVRFGWRMLHKNPGFTVVAVVTLALGIGANAAIFSVVRGVLLRPLANRDEDRLLYLRQSTPGNDDVTFSIPEIQDIGAKLKTITALGSLSTISFTVVGIGEPREISAGVVDGTYFEVMGLRPVVGRLLTPNDDGPNAAGAVVLTYRFWATSLHSDASVIGKTVRLGSLGDLGGTRSAVIVGVVEPSVPYPMETQIFANIVTSPHHLSATMVTGRDHRMTEVFARLAPGADLESARSEIRTVYGSMLAAHPEFYKPSGHFQIDVTRIHDQINSRASTILWVLFAASGLLFVIACSNVANLFLARAVRREPELALRSALGASTAILRRSLLAEALVLCGTGLLAGVIIAAPMVKVLSRYAARYSVVAVGLTLDSTLLWIGVALALIAAVFLAFVPRLPSADTSRGFGISSSSVRITGGSRRRLRVFAVTQIAASFLLLAGAGALLRTLWVLQKAQPQFETAHVLAINLPVMTDGRTREQVHAFYRDVRDRIGALPGVQHTATGLIVPWRDALGSSFSLAFAAQGARRENSQEDPRARLRFVSPGYFDTLGVPILHGRDFDVHDRDGEERVVIVSQSVANQVFPGQDPVNRRLSWSDPIIRFAGISGEPRRIIAVVPDVDDGDIIPSPAMTIYQPTEQEGMNGRLFVRTKNDPYALVPTITREVHQMAADQPVERVSTLSDIRAEVMTPERLNAIVFGGFASLALLISVVGVAGVLAFSVSGRTREFGIRLALGAPSHHILTDVLREGLVIAGIGVGSGVIVGFAAVRAIAKYTTDLQIPGAWPLIASAALMLAAALVASAMPAVRAARVDAVQALRAE
jgi:putative ABC transport system permease protein